MIRIPAFVAAAALALSCRSPAPQVRTNLDVAARNQLLDAIKGLAGKWEFVENDGTRGTTEICVTSAGTAVREILFPGGAHEMTNMYHLDGNELILTHYCGAGNQPRMYASRIDGNQIRFLTDSVSDLKDPNEEYMGRMTLQLLDHDHMNQLWWDCVGDKVAAEYQFSFTRAK